MIAIKLTEHDLLEKYSETDIKAIPSIESFKIASDVLLLADTVHWERTIGKTTTRAVLFKKRISLQESTPVVLNSSLCKISEDSFPSDRDAEILSRMIGCLVSKSFSLEAFNTEENAHPLDLAEQSVFSKSFREEE
jgi:hypothetical protein